ncbi:hypothetical protein SKAU_G00200450 [Synaphobranchus kaupii]|uniref:Uncharacterized protein n=1 Tax=Synaphobranchus kaupii TaxID=118154 RepID=A0A9Q1IXS9_SYNKA|nr:hypothetical protein SKAU_G00200450 [Synaphobranchus kaupii]
MDRDGKRAVFPQKGCPLPLSLPPSATLLATFSLKNGQLLSFLPQFHISLHLEARLQESFAGFQQTAEDKISGLPKELRLSVSLATGCFW